MIPTLHIHLFGDFLLLAGDTPVTAVNVPRLQSLLAYLVLHRSAPQARSHLAFLLWPDSTEAQAHVNLRKALHHLRQALPDAEYFLHADRQSLHWQPSRSDASWTLDVLDFEEALASAKLAEETRNMKGALLALEHATHLYRGDLLPTCYDEWILPERDRLRQEFLYASERLIALLEEERDYEAAIKAAQQHLHYDSLHEEIYRRLMRLHALRGDRAAALRAYHTCVTVLERELGTEPSEATHQAYESLMQLDTSTKSRTGPLSPRSTGAPLVGRKEEWRQLQATWRLAAGGHPHMVVLTGEAGIGKTRLAEELVAWVDRQGMRTASAHCYAAEGALAYAPVTKWLRAGAVQPGLSALSDTWLSEVARLLPDLLASRPDLPRPAPMTEGWQRQHFLEALAHVLLRASQSSYNQPLLLMLDDLQWCESETLEWLHYLLRFEPGARLLLVGTVRSEEILPGHPLLAFLGALQREGLLTEITLSPLDSYETTSLAEHIVGRQLDPATSSSLYQETEGNPLFVVEMVRAGTLPLHPTRSQARCTASLQGETKAGEYQESEQPVAGSSFSLLTQSASTLPPTVQVVLSTRLAQLSPLAREVANVAAVIGREFSFAVLARASGESEDIVVRGLDELWQRRILREQGTENSETYDFSHDKLREQAYASLGPAQRRLLHRRVAEAFESVYAGTLSNGQVKLDTISRQVATHYEHAGLPERAIPYYQRAGEIAMLIYANAEAITAFQQAATLLEAVGQEQIHQEQQWEAATEIYASLGDIFAMTGRHQEARLAYQLGMAHIPSQLSQSDQQFLWRARLLRKTASTWNLASDNPMDTFHVNARLTFQEAECILEQAEVKSSTGWLQEWIDLQIDQLLPLRGSVDEMTAIIEKAEAIVEQYGTVEQRGRFFQAVVARDAARDRYVVSEENVSYCRHALAALMPTGNKGLIGFAHFVLGNRLLWTDKLEEAEEEMRAAIDLAEQIGNTTLLTRCLMFLPFIFRRRGQVEGVRGIVTRALSVPEARNIAIIKGHRAWIAWRDGNLVEAETYGRASLEERQGRPYVNAFQWAGLWPLIGVALVQEKLTEAIDYTRMLFKPTQQRQPEKLSVLLEAALQAWDAGQQEQARTLLQQTVPLAGEMGYL